MSDFLVNPHKACDFQLRWPVIPLGGSHKPEKEEDWPHGVAARPASLGKLVIGRGMKYHHSKAEFLGGI